MKLSKRWDKLTSTYLILTNELIMIDLVLNKVKVSMLVALAAMQTSILMKYSNNSLAKAELMTFLRKWLSK